MTILFLDQFSELGGAQLNLLALLPAITRKGWNLHAVLPGDERFARILTANGIPVHNLSLADYSLGRKGIRDGLRFAAGIRSLRDRLRQLSTEVKPDLIYVNGPRWPGCGPPSL
jgi:hypothetical protein